MQHFTYKYWSTTQTKGGLILETLEKKPQKTLNHKNPKSHISFLSLPEQPLTAPVKNWERTGAAGRLLFPAHKGRPPLPFLSSSPFSAPPSQIIFTSSQPISPQPTGLLPWNRRHLHTAAAPLCRSPSPSPQLSFPILPPAATPRQTHSLHHLLRRRLQLLHQAQRQPPLSSSPPISINAGSTRSQQQSRSPSPQTHGSRFNQRVFPSSAAEQPPAAATNPAAATDSPPASGAARSGTWSRGEEEEETYNIPICRRSRFDKKKKKTKQIWKNEQIKNVNRLFVRFLLLLQMM